MSNYPKVTLTEEGMRDGLQIERADIAVGDKIRLLDALSETGLKEIAVGSFVSPRWVPQMACIDELVKGFHPKPGVTYTATALNDMRPRTIAKIHVRRCQRSTNMRRRRRSISATCSPSAISTVRSRSKWRAGRKRSRRPRAKGAKEAGISVSAAWGSNWTGEVSQDDRMKMLETQYQLWQEAGIPVTKIGISDPMGWNMPDQVEHQLASDQKALAVDHVASTCICTIPAVWR